MDLNKEFKKALEEGYCYGDITMNSTERYLLNSQKVIMVEEITKK